MNDSKVIMNGLLIDGLGNPPVKEGALAIQNGIIIDVGDHTLASKYENFEMINVMGKTIMPGLIDAHVHLWGVHNMDVHWVLEPKELRAIRSVLDAWKILDSGFTFVRDCGNPSSIFLKQAVEEGKAVGPNIVACGAIITQTGGHGDMAHYLPAKWSEEMGIARVADGVAECRKAAREQIRAGADFLKICSTGGVHSMRDKPGSAQFTVEEIAAITEEAHRVGIKVASHAQGETGIKNALTGGVDTIEHGFYLTDALIEEMIDKNVYYVPTLAAMEVMAGMNPVITGLPEISFQKAKLAYEAHKKTFRRAIATKLKIGCGTDWEGADTTPFDGLAIELVLQVREGRKPLDVIQSATSINAQILGVDDVTGSLQAGKNADIIIVDGNPAEDIGVLRDRANILRVYKKGGLCPRLNLNEK